MRIHSILGFVAASVFATTAHAKVEVVTTVPDLAALTREVGGDKVSITSLSLPTQDPHFVDAKPSLVLKLNKADLLVAVGLDLEIGWLPVLQNGARNPKVGTGAAGYLECASAVKVLERPDHPVDRSMGDIHPGGNPHYLFDPRNAASCAQAIATKLSVLDPGNAKTYAANAKAFVEKLDKARGGWEKRMQPYKGKSVITFHRSWIYLVQWLQLTSIGELEPKPGIPPTSRHVAALLQLGMSRGVKCVMQEAFYPDKTGHLVAKKLGGTVVLLPSGTDVAAGETYITHMDHVIGALETCLK
jgi:zinc/manganese transport system substrate-binding protein